MSRPRKRSLKDLEDRDDGDGEEAALSNKKSSRGKNGRTSTRSRQKKPSKAKSNRPPPPPAPPKSLVKLLQLDPSVLSYFQALQANLEADVEIWKTRAKEYQRENDDLKKQLKKKHAPPATITAHSLKKAPPPNPQDTLANSEPSRDGDSNNDRQEENNTTDSVLATEHNTHEEEEEVGIPITEAMLELDDDDSDEDEDQDRPLNDSKLSPRTSRKDAANGVDQQTAAADAQLEKQMNAVFALASSSSDDDEEEEVQITNDSKATSTQQSEKQKQEKQNSELLALEGDSADDAEKATACARKTTRPEAQTVRPAPSLEDSDDEDDEEWGFSLAKANDGASTIDVKPMAQPKDRPEAKLLREAFQALEHLGVALVEERKLPSKEMDGTEDGSTRPQTTRSWIPRSDDDVAADLMWTIHNLCRFPLSHSDLLQHYPPFATKDLIPACNYTHGDGDKEKHDNQPNHPVIQGQALLFRALVIMDTYCFPGLFSEEAWTEMFVTRTDSGDDDGHLAPKMTIGLKGRKRLVERFIESLYGEITTLWPVQDRCDAFNTPAFHMTKSDPEGTENSENHPNQALDGKIQGRLASLVERAVLAQLVIAFYLSRDDIDQAVDLIWRYLLSTAPGQDEDYPKLAPVFSFVVFESMVCLQQPNMIWWPTPRHIGNMLFYEDGGYGEDTTKSEAVKLARKTVHLCTQAAASIWKQRIRADTPRVRDLARVEVAAYQRLVAAGVVIDEPLDDWKTHAVTARETNCQQVAQDGGRVSRLEVLAFQLCSILGDCNQTGRTLSDLSADNPMLVARCHALREIEMRQLENHRNAIGADVGALVPFEYWLRDDCESLDSVDTASLDLVRVTSLMRGAAIVADGKSVLKCANALMRLLDSSSEHSGDTSEALSLLREIALVPVVRVINLRARTDRLKAFCTQAMVHGLTVVHALAPLKDNPPQPQSENICFGQHAFDGRGKLLEASTRLSEQVGEQLDSLVDTRWRPHDLKPFDSNAPDSEHLVRTSPSERACALSHIASWKGALRSFRSLDQAENVASPVLRHPQVLRRLFHLSGFAEGVALHPSNRNMDPVPVCVVLEDDAILVDRFTDRLRDVLKDLPRDFHFCSLGYSRPKTAPIVSFRKHVGIPTNLFYLTGYVISEAGADFLQQNLPVVGPVDSWIGLKMTDNFDNVFGTVVGVGRTKTLAEPLAQRDLCMILKFRAFCAMQPLCSQRVGDGVSGASGGARKGWRQRDTDIQYSGNSWQMGI